MDIKIEGMDRVIGSLDKVAKGMENLKPAFEDMKGVIIQEFKANFDGRGEVLSAPWKPRKKNYPWPLLVKTGTLKKNWKDEVSDKELRIENPTDYATYHHFGTPRLPARKLVGKSENILKIASTRIIAYIKSLL